MRRRSFSLFSQRKAEDKAKPSAAGAAILVLLIALLVILYVLFLPPGERCSLLDNCDQVGVNPGGTPVGVPVSQATVLYSANPGEINDRPPEVYSLPSFQVRTITSGNTLADRSGLTVEHSVFHHDEAVMSFALPQAASNLLLSFSVEQAQGDLQIDLNGERIFDAPLSSRQPPAISLPASLLQQNNVLTFGVSGVGFSFWDTNMIQLSNVRVTGDVTDFGMAGQQLQFVLPTLESLHRTQLSFVPDCEFGSTSRLSVMLNGNIIYSGVPECGTPLRFDLAESRLRAGENILSFETTSGSYYLDQIEVVVDREQNDRLHRFDLSSELLSRAIAENRPISLELSFMEPGAEGRMMLNGRELAFRTHRSQFSGSIMNYVEVGENRLEFVSSTTPVRQLRILYG